MAQKGFTITRPLAGDMKIADITAREEATNAGIPTVGVTVRLENGVTFGGATPLGTSAGTDEAIHLIDSTVEKCAATDKHAATGTHGYNEAHADAVKLTGVKVGSEEHAQLPRSSNRFVQLPFYPFPV